jgi:chaperone BCS1
MDQTASDAVSTQVPSIGNGNKEDVIRQLAEAGVQGDGSIFAQLSSNPFFTAGFGLAALGAAMRYGSQGLRRGVELAKRRLLVDVEVTRHDESYEWVLNWMTAQFQHQLEPHALRRNVGITDRIIRRLTPGLHHLQIATARSKTAGGSEQTAFSLVPGHGKHILRYKNAFISVNRERIGKSFDAVGRPFETVTMTTLYHHRRIFEDIFQEAHQMNSQHTEGKTIIYTSRNIQWDSSGQPKRRRPFDSVVLAEGLANKIITDIREFIAAREWYLDRGIPYRRGYLLHGPPGTGKTSFVQALAGELDFNIAMLSLSQRGLTDDLLNQLLLTVPARTIVLLEDADAAFSNRQQADETGYSGATVTFSGLLNALDGVASAEERIIFMTTNHIDRLDDALVRPGRVDMSVHLGNATGWQMEKLWDRFYAQYDPDGTGKQQFMARANDAGLVGKVSTAALQGLFLYNKDDPGGAIAMVDQLKTLSSSSGK